MVTAAGAVRAPGVQSARCRLEPSVHARSHASLHPHFASPGREPFEPKVRVRCYASPYSGWQNVIYLERSMISLMGICLQGGYNNAV